MSVVTHMAFLANEKHVRLFSNFSLIERKPQCLLDLILNLGVKF